MKCTDIKIVAEYINKNIDPFVWLADEPFSGVTNDDDSAKFLLYCLKARYKETLVINITDLVMPNGNGYIRVVMHER